MELKCAFSAWSSPGLLAITARMAAHANGPGSNLWATNAGPASNLVLVWDGGGSGAHSGAIGGRPIAGRASNGTGVGLCSLGTKPSVRRAGPVWWVAGADLLGLGSWECGLRLSLRGLARPDRRLG